MKKILYMYICIALLSVTSLGIVLAAFSYKNKYVGSTFTIGSAVIKLLKNLSLGPDPSNLADELPGPGFQNIGEGWYHDYPIKIFNGGSSNVKLSSRANYTTVNDPDNLRDIIFVEIFTWNDLNSDGVIDPGEKATTQGAPKSILRWKNDGIEMGQIESGQTRNFILSFFTQMVSDSKQGKTAIFDFEFDSQSL